MKPRIFIGSSSENREIAEAIQNNIMDVSYPEIWDQSLKSLSQSTLTNLVQALDIFDFAIFVFGAEDNATIRDKNVLIVRDNVIFETGLFMGRLGIDHVFFVKPYSQEIHMPSDLLGITYGLYDIDHPNKDAALRQFCKQVKEQIRQLYQPVFPDNGVYGENILSSRLNDLIGNSDFCANEKTYGLYARTSSSQKISVTITLISTSNENGYAPWYYGTGQIQGWLPSEFNDTQTFVLEPRSNGILKIFFVGNGSANIIVTLNDDTTHPIFKKEIYWRQNK
ncbi:MAG: nucleotide-binding protein [Muribaculum sp.]